MKFHIHNAMDSGENILGNIWRVYQEDYDYPWPRGCMRELGDTATELPKLLGTFDQTDIAMAVAEAMKIIRDVCPDVGLTQVTMFKS